MKSSSLGRAAKWTAIAAVVAVPLWVAAQTVCAVVKLEILQKATMERVGFDAQLGITNSLVASPLTSVAVTISIKDKNGLPADGLFFVKVGTRTNVTALDGTGVLQPQVTANVGWLIVPSTGAGGSDPLGQTYSIKATVNFIGNGILQSLTTLDAPITVMPQPFLRLQYVLPRDIAGDDPLTQVVESSATYMLGLRVVNEGFGPAKNMKVDSAQPHITSNQQGLAVDFKIQATFVGTATVPNSLQLPFGDIPAGGVKLGGWSMISNLSGRFIDFQASFTHDPGLGGALTSLIGGVSTYWLIKDVLDDGPGRDAQFDFLVSTQSTLSGDHPIPTQLIGSDVAQAFPVGYISSNAVTLTGNLSSTDPILQMTFTAPNTTGWQYIVARDPLLGAVDLISVVRLSDNKSLNPRNFWQGSPYYKPDEGAAPKLLHFFEFNPTGSYRLTFKQSQLDFPPDPVANLTLSTDSVGSLRLNWTSTGEDRSSGTVFNGRYAIIYSTAAVFSMSTSAAQVVITTSVAELSAQGLGVSGLIGGTTYYARLATADKKIQWSLVSNTATGYTLAYPAASAAVVSLSTGGFILNFSSAVNAPGTQQRIELTTAAAPPVATYGFLTDISSAPFSGLNPNTVYTVRARALSPAGIESPATVVATVTTPPQAPTVAAVAIDSVEAGSVTVNWNTGANPPATQYVVSAATGPALAPLVSTTVFTSSAVVLSLTPDTSWYFSVYALGGAGASTALSIGSTMTAVAAPAGVAVVSVAPSSAAYSWGASAPDNPGVTPYRLELSTATDYTGDVFSSVTVRAAGSAVVASLVSNSTYYARVIATGQDGRSRLTAGATIYTAAVAAPTASPLVQVGSQTVSAAWGTAGNVAETRYTLEASTAADFSAVVLSSNVLAAAATVSGLLPDATWHLRVRATVGLSASPYTSLGSTVTLPAFPALPASPFVAVGSDTVSAAWLYSFPVTGFRLELSTAADFTGTIFSSAAVDSSVRSLAVGGLARGILYNARVAAVGRTGRESYLVLGSTRSTLPAPTLVAPVSVAASSFTLTVQWGDGGNPADAQYTLRASTAPDFSGTVTSSATSATTATLSGLSADAAYYLTVFASSGAAHSPTLSLGLLLTLAPAPGAASAAFLAASSEAVTAAWSAPPVGSGYRIEASTASNFTGTVFSSATSQLSLTTLTVSGLAPNRTYTLRVASLNSEGAANYAALGSTVTAADAPVAVSAAASTYSVSASWSTGDDPAGTVFTAQLSTDAFTTLNASSATVGVTADFYGLLPNTTYALRVRAENSAGSPSAFTAPISTVTLAAAPVGVATVALDTDSVRGSWTAGGNPAGTVFTLQSSTNGFSTVNASSSTPGASASFAGLLPNTTYYLRVSAANSAGTASAFTTVGSTATPAVVPATAAFSGVTDVALVTNWLSGGNPAGTLYEVALSTDAYATLVSSSRTVAATFAFSGLTAAQAYAARVRVLGRDGGTSAYASLGSTTTVASLPGPLAFSGVGLSTVTANWTANGNPAGTVYAAQVSTDAFATVNFTSATKNQFADFTGLASNGAYAFRVGVQTVGVYAALGSTATMPATPSLMTSLSLAADTVRANWGAAGNAAGTNYLAEISSDAFSTLVNLLQTSNGFAVFNGLLPNRAYALRVRALSSAWPATAYQALASTYTLAASPSTAAFTGITATQIQANWAANGNPAGTIYEAQASTDSFTGILASSQTANAFAPFLGLLNGTTYYFRVLASNANGAQTAFTVLGSTVMPLVSVPIPTSVALDNPLTTDVSLRFTWQLDTPASEAVHDVLAADAAFTVIVASETQPVGALSRVFTGLTPNTSYWFKVKISTVGDFGYAPTVVGVTRSRAVGAGSLSAPTTATILAAWTANGNPAGTTYKLEWTSAAFAGASSVQQTALSISMTGLLANTSYQARVTAIDTGGNASAPFSIGVLATLAQAPTPPGGGNPWPALYQTSATVSWTPLPASPQAAAAHGYRVEIATDTDFAYPFLVAIATNGLDGRLSLQGLAPQVTFYYRVGALNPAGAPNWLVLGSTRSISQTINGTIVDSTIMSRVTVAVATTPVSVVDLMTVEAPPGAFPMGSVMVVNSSPTVVPPPISLQAHLSPLGATLDLNTQGLQPSSDVTIRMRYEVFKLPVLTGTQRVVIARYDPNRGSWVMLPTTHNSVTREIIALTNHFSLFGAFIVESALNLDSVQVLPIPWKPGSGGSYDAAAVMLRNLTFPAAVRVYDILGENVWSGESDANGALDWLGINSSGGLVGSGVYQIVIQSGTQTVRRRAVIIR